MAKLHVLVLLATASCGPLGAQAQEGGRSRASLQPFCLAGYTRLCAGLDPNGTEVVACFRANARKVSPGCREAIAKYSGMASGQSDISP
ncbi:hypothetical protein [Methylobacterium sp. J-076]|uniref:hypothetical protein n=1 Tax=Methylobacterium sp. J-076 TaxID=2836655 RepID=UPI001FBA6217|nr:hypothetical protein [Methylobacterium sp. J-076]MCJ2012210.1 hypothetical protein [Methylobacterium sp. J-076]